MSSLRSIAQRVGARLVDGSHAHVEGAQPLPLDQCAACVPLLPSLGGRACLMDDARRQTNYLGAAPQDRTEAAARGVSRAVSLLRCAGQAALLGSSLTL